MKKHSNSVKKSESPMKRRTPRAEERRDSSEVMAELVSQLRQQLNVQSVPSAESAGEEGGTGGASKPGSSYGGCVSWRSVEQRHRTLGLAGETLGEASASDEATGSWRVLSMLWISRVVIEVGTHSAWVREVIAGLGHEVLVANAQRMEGRKRRRRNNLPD